MQWVLWFLPFLFTTEATICLFSSNTSLALGANYTGITPPPNGLAVQGNTEIGCSTYLNKLDVAGNAAFGLDYACIVSAPTNGIAVEGAIETGCHPSKNQLDVSGSAAIGASYACTSTGPSNGLIVQGQVGIGTSSPNSALALDVTSTTQGIAPPRMNTTQVNAISNPPDGSLVYDTTISMFKGRQGGTWYPTSGDVLISMVVMTNSSIGSVSFTPLPTIFNHLRVVIMGRTTAASVNGIAYFQYNGDTGANYDYESFTSVGTTIAGAASTAQTSTLFCRMNGASHVANSAGHANAFIPFYGLTTFFKTHTSLTTEISSTEQRITYYGGSWRNTAAITNLTVLTDSGVFFTTGTAITLYGVY